MSEEVKTNVMRLVEEAGYDYAGLEMAQANNNHGLPVYKTLVTEGRSGDHYVFEVPVEEELDLKAAAQAVGEKKVHMIKEKELEPLTGYVHGGCSPIGMKKSFKTVIDNSAFAFDRIAFSAGKRGQSIVMSPEDLEEMLGANRAQVAKEKM